MCETENPEKGSGRHTITAPHAIQPATCQRAK